MKTFIQTLSFILLVTQIGFAQWYQQSSGTTNETEPTWVRHYSTNEAPSRNEYNSMVIDRQCNVYLGGSAEESFPRRSIMMLSKFNSQGVEQWILRDTSLSPIVKLAFDSTGNIVVLMNDGIMKYSPAGNMLWILEDENLQWNEILHIDHLDNVFIRCHDSNTDVDVIVKINIAGVEQWRINISGLVMFDLESNCYSTNSEETIDHTASEIVTRKFNSLGILQWESRYKKSNSNWPLGIELNGPDIIIIGVTSETPGENYSFEELRYGTDGTLKLNFGIGTYPWYPKWALADDGSLYMYFGWSYMGSQYTLYKYGANGVLLWGAMGGGYSDGPLAIDSEGNVFVSYMETYGGHYGVTKYNKNGSLIWKTLTPSKVSYWGVPRGLLIGEGGKVYLFGEIDGYHIWQFSSNGTINWAITRTPPSGYNIDHQNNLYCLGENWQTNASLEKYSSLGILEWSYVYEGNKIPQDYPADMSTDSSGNVYVLSEKQCKDRVGFAVIKYNALGDLLWVREGPCTNTPRMANSMKGSTYITGEIRFYDSIGVHTTQFVEKISEEGNIEWSAEYNPVTNTELSTQSIMYDESGNVTVISDKSEPEKPSGILIQNFNTTGTLNWSVESFAEQINSNRTFGAATLDKDGNLLLSVRDTDTQDKKTHFTLKFNPSGQQLWSNTIQTGDTLYSFSAITSTENGSVIVTGSGEHNGITIGLIIINYDENGNQRWLVRDTDYLTTTSLKTDINGNIFILGTSSDSLGSACLIGGYDGLGNRLWRQKHQHNLWFIHPPKMTIDNQGKIYVLCGDKDLNTTCYSNEGMIEWTDAFKEPDWNVEHFPGELAWDRNDHLYVLGGSGEWVHSWWGRGGGDYLDAGVLVTLRYDLVSTNIILNDPFQPEHFTLYQNFPNPFNPSTNIKYSIPNEGKVSLIVFNLLGEEVTTLVNEEQSAGNYKVEFNISSLPSGVYFYQLLVSALRSKDGKAGSFVETKKMILLR